MRKLILIVIVTTPARLVAQHDHMHSTPAAEHVLTAARQSVASITDTGAARAAGYRPIEELGVPDRNPFQGQHWYSRAHSDTLPEARLDAPAFVLFSPINGRLERIAVAYAVRLRHETAPPAALGDDSSAMWHIHVLCNFTSPSGRPIVDQLPDTAVCRARGGQPQPRRTVMIHVWTDVTNPEGVYGHDNPALPFLAVGLTPPNTSTREARELALALGESYGAGLENGYLIEQANTNMGLADSLRAHRAVIRDLVPLLRRAEAAHDNPAYARAATRMRGEGRAIERIYEQMAQPDALTALRAQYQSILTKSTMQ